MPFTMWIRSVLVDAALPTRHGMTHVRPLHCLPGDHLSILSDEEEKEKTKMERKKKFRFRVIQFLFLLLLPGVLNYIPRGKKRAFFPA